MAFTIQEINMKLRFFGSDDCEKCKSFKQSFSLLGIKYDYVDAGVDKNQALCEKNKVDKLPHIQIVDDSDKVVYEEIEKINVPTLVMKLRGRGSAFSRK